MKITTTQGVRIAQALMVFAVPMLAACPDLPDKGPVVGNDNSTSIPADPENDSEAIMDGGAVTNASSDAGTTGRPAADAGSLPAAEPPATDGGVSSADAGREPIDCRTINQIEYEWLQTEAPCGQPKLFSVKGNGRLLLTRSEMRVLEGATNETCESIVEHHEVFQSTTQDFIEQVCHDLLATHDASATCDAPTGAWRFFTDDELEAELVNLGCAGSGMTESVIEMNKLLDRLRAPNTCQFGCETSSDCAADESCMGANASDGHCVETNPGFSTSCDGAALGLDCACVEGDTPCAEGLTCIGDLMPEGFPGPICQPAWWANAFFSNETVEVSPADNGSTSSSTLTVCGLYTVPYGGLLTLELEAVDLTPLTASLQRDGADPITITLTEEGLTSGISIQPPTDEAVNGDWTLTLSHSGEGPSATLHGWSVYFESWPD